MSISSKIQSEPKPPVIPAFIDEPVASEPGQQLSTYHLVQAFRWYNDNISDDGASKYLGADLETTKRFLTLAWCERLRSRGFMFPDRETATYEFMKDTYNQFVANRLQARVDRPKVDIQAVTKKKAMDILTLLEGHLNDSKPNWYELANAAGVKPAHVPFMLDEITAEKEQINHPELYDGLIADLDRIRKNKVGTRSPRKRKLLKPEKVIGSLQYLPKSDTYKVESIKPESIIGARGLWVFNTQYKSITHYVAGGPSGLTVSGTTIKSFEPGESTNRALRKPLEVLPLILDKTSKQARKVIDGLTTKSYTPNGRINANMILLKADR